MSVSTYVNLRPKRSVILPGEGVIARIGGPDSSPVCMVGLFAKALRPGLP